jgi:hypothetical protein
MTYRGIVRGEIIELEAAPPLEDGQVVNMRVLPAVRSLPKPPATTTGPGAGAGSPAAVREAMHAPPRLSAEDVDELERAIQQSRLPVREAGVFEDAK